MKQHLWVLAKSEDDKAKLNNVLYHLAENLRIAGALLQPFMRATSGKIFEQLGMDERSFSLENLSFGYSFTHPVVAKVNLFSHVLMWKKRLLILNYKWLVVYCQKKSGSLKKLN